MATYAYRKIEEMRIPIPKSIISTSEAEDSIAPKGLSLNDCPTKINSTIKQTIIVANLLIINYLPFSEHFVFQ